MGDREKYKCFPQLLPCYFIKQFFSEDSTSYPVLGSGDTELKDISCLWENYPIVEETDEESTITTGDISGRVMGAGKKDIKPSLGRYNLSCTLMKRMQPGGEGLFLGQGKKSKKSGKQKSSWTSGAPVWWPGVAAGRNQAEKCSYIEDSGRPWPKSYTKRGNMSLILRV